MAWRTRVSAVLMAAVFVGCTDFVAMDASGTEGGGSDTSDSDPTVANSSDSNSTTAASDSNSGDSTTMPIDPPTDSNSDSASTTAPDTDADTTDPTTDPTTDTTGPETSGSETTASATTGPMGCVQQDSEPNDAFEEAQEIPEQPCSADASSFTGTLEDENDVDRFVYFSPWDCGNDDPDHVYTVDGPVELCVNAVCANGSDIEAFCQEGNLGPVDGLDYCCGTTAVRLDVNCQGPNEATTAVVVVRPDALALECADYTFTYQIQPE